jgi:hypothetical protein
VFGMPAHEASEPSTSDQVTTAAAKAGLVKVTNLPARGRWLETSRAHPGHSDQPKYLPDVALGLCPRLAQRSSFIAAC